jgi:hypothetical protein
MEPKKKRSVVLIIRRFLAGYIFLSVVVQLIGEISEGEFSASSLDDLAFGLLIVFFLAFYSRKKKVDQEPKEDLEQPTISKNYEDTDNIDILEQEDIQSYDEDIEIEDLETQIDEVEIKTEDGNPPSGYNPVKDNEGIFSRFFKGRNN